MEEDELQLFLIKLAEEKEISYTKKQIEKMDVEKMEMIYKQYKLKELEELNETVTELFIEKLDEVMKRYDFIKKESKLAQKLQNKKLFKQDVKNIVSYFTPILPYVGLFEGVVTIGGEVVDKYMEAKSEEEKNEEEKNEEDV